MADSSEVVVVGAGAAGWAWSQAAGIEVKHVLESRQPLSHKDSATFSRRGIIPNGRRNGGS